ncbi:MAG: RIP metalloprotease RseP [Chloroflexota bacterium]
MDFNWLWVVPVLGVLIVVHEMGHFFTAIWLGIKVEEFGIGFPPRLFAIRRKGVDYSINLLPIGGFVKITGENGDSDDPKSFGKAAAWKRIIVLAAGSFMNLVLALAIFTAMAVAGTREVNSTIAPSVGIYEITAGAPAAVGQMQVGDEVVKIAGQPVASDDDIRSLSEQNAGKATVFTVLRDNQEVPLTITPNTSTPFLGVILYPWYAPAKVDALASDSAAAKAGLQNGDTVLSVNGVTVTNNISAKNAIQKSSGPLTLVVQGTGAQRTVTVDKSGTGFTINNLFLPIRTVYYSPLEALGRALNNTWSVVASIPTGIAQALAGKSDGPGVTSIVGIGQITGEVAQEAGFNGLLNLTALLGISLFMINLLPLPALDGGRLLFILIELLRGGRKIAPEKEGMVHFAGMVVLLALMAIITFFDVSRLFQGGHILP